VQDSKISYFLVWRNGYDRHYYAPYEGQKSVPDFLKMIQSGKVLLEKGAQKKNLYKTR
jgi:mannan endo-1,4-beta-mannosidase